MSPSQATTEPIARAASELERQRRRPMPVGAVLTDLDQALHSGELRGHLPVPTGFEELDHVIGGGVRSGEVMLIGGGQGIGKTTLTLQMARNMALSGAQVLYVCYEHDERFLLTRLLTMETVEQCDDEEECEPGMRLRDVLAQIDDTAQQTDAGLQALVDRSPELTRAVERLSGYADRLHLLRGSGTNTDLTTLTTELSSLRDADPSARCVLFLDYLQKVPVHSDSQSESERVTQVIEGVKDLALSRGVSVVAIVAADKVGLQAPRLRLHHLRGSSAILYEADIILLLNEKHRIVTKQYLTFNPHQAQRLNAWVVCSIEKNRTGRPMVDIEFQKRFEHACFDPVDRLVAEALIDERIEPE